MRRGLLTLLAMSVVAVVVLSLVAVRLAAQTAKAAAGKVPAQRAGARAPGAPVGCADLTKLTFEGNTTITAATSVAGGTFMTPAGQTLTGLPAFCRVVGVSRPTSDSNINFEVWLPSDSWNGKFLSSGEGGFAGTINYTRSGLDGGLDELIRRGYASASTDTGHLSTDTNWAIGHPEKVIDYAHRSKHLVTVAAKGLIAAFYGRPAAHSYFNSCSNGGRQALMEAQRYPEDYDGLVVGAPWNYQSHSNAGFVWDAQTLSAPGAAIPASKLPAIHAAAIAACDAADGLADNLIEDPGRCSFKPETLLCKGADNDSCLTAPQVTALKKLYEGPRHPRTGASIFPGWAKGSELGWTRLVSSGNFGNLGRGYFGNLVFEKPDWDYRSFDFDTHLALAESKVGKLGDAVNPDLSAARRRGVKIIQYHGWNDAVLQPAYSPEYYQRVAAAMGGLDETRDFFRLFMVPGMAHCYSGPGANSFGGVGQQIPPTRDAVHDVQIALENWVERRKAPDQFIATKYADDSPQTRQVQFTRLLCPYPMVARYKKSGDSNDARNFTCVKP
ncbi:MAG TPA: tannase/feruloyl esterase family alpha/beta hydrolase [Vicinamibacterales bacterium]|jgi:feruloyl esterase|nr:tannase/feruloyl esterase family alpha/beta hydrolase [Vicinamibacterales bacterium]